MEWLVDNVRGLPVIVAPVIASDKNGVEKLYVSDISSCNSTVYKQNRSVELFARTIDQIAIDEHLPLWILLRWMPRSQAENITGRNQDTDEQ